MLTPMTSLPHFVTREERANLTSSTPASFSDIPPMLRFQDDAVRLEFDPPYEGKSSYTGGLWVIESDLAFFSPSQSNVETGFSISWPSIILHAVSRNPELGDCLYCQVSDSSIAASTSLVKKGNGNGNGHSGEAVANEEVEGDGSGYEQDDEDEGGEEDEPMREMRVYVKDEATLNQLYNAFSDCSSLHPAPSSDDFDAAQSFFPGMGDAAAGEWITAENAHLFNAEDGTFDDAEDDEGAGAGADRTDTGRGNQRFQPY